MKPQTIRAQVIPVALSETEKAQLGSTRLLQNGKASQHPWPTSEEWPLIRKMLVERSQRSNPLLDPTLTAYTPGETLHLLKNPVVASWHETHAVALEAQYRRIVLVPCAKTKPWTGPAVKRSRLYSAYNALQDELEGTLFVTVSEPLGVVPSTRWADFPQYDNPGLFADDAQRSGMFSRDWTTTTWQSVRAVPYDPETRAECLEILGTVLGRFLTANIDRTVVSFVDETKSAPGTHQLMLDFAVAQSGLEVVRYPKRVEARTSPLEWMRSILTA